jgi:hypothetical protein
MRWVTREYVRTEQARRRSVWHRWFAWYPVVVSVEGGVDHWVWFERLERKWSVGGYGDQKGHWRYRHLVVDAERANLQAEQYDDVTRDGSEGRVPPDLGGHQNRPGESRLH